MPRYIDATLLKAEFTGNFIDTSYSPEFIKAIIDRQPTADVQEVRHGKWIGYPSISISKRRRTVQSMIYKCSCCGKSNGRAKSPYCKNCGSKMCGDESEAKIEEVEEKK